MSCLTLQPGYQPIAGYVLKEKLGAGGYGEVWSADAPGGLTKAIKFVFGSIDDQRGSTELRSLNRMRKLNHPFLLSIERVEVVESQLVIVSELAHGSLLDRFLEYRQKGFNGIPRERLLRYFSDAAEGLDYLCQEHGLQHLDVKPGNLLLVADRVKVADFGLIKKLQSFTQSAQNGLTPMYAAPEMFDGRPSAQSDQYSLAVAYIELLTGSLPFRGRTCAQLANEHLNKAAILEFVPVIERPVLAKALAKKPHLRFDSCREFIRALESCAADRKTPLRKIRTRPFSDVCLNNKESSKTKSGDDKESVKESQALSPAQSASLSSETNPLRVHSPLPPRSSETEFRPPKVLFLGLGGTGGSAIQTLQTKLSQDSENKSSKEGCRLLYIDTDAESVEQSTSLHNLHAIHHSDTLTLRLNSAQYFRQCKAPDLNRVSRRWIYNIPRSQKTDGVRPLGMLAFLDNAKACYESLLQAVEELVENEPDDSNLRVYLMASAHGGTGGAIVSEIGHFIRHIAASLELTVDIQVLLLCASSPDHQSTGLEVASAVACLEDIGKTVESGGLHEPLQCIPAAESFHQIPFDQVTLIHGGILGRKQDWLRSIETMVEYAWTYHYTDLGMRLALAQAKRQAKAGADNRRPHGLWLKVIGARQLSTPTHLDSDQATKLGCLHALNGWISLIKKQAGDIRALQRNPKPPSFTPLQLSWVNELFRGQQLSASSWIRRVIAAFASFESQPVAAPVRQAASLGHDAMIPFDWISSKEILDEIEMIARQLNCDPNRSKAAISELMNTAYLQLWPWLEKSALHSLSGWTHLWDILESIEQRFEENIERIQSVASKLQEKYAATETTWNSLGKDHDSDFALTLETLSLEVRFHHLGARLQTELAQKITDISNRWMRQSLRMLGEMTETSVQLLNELEIQDDSTLDQPDISELMMNPYYCEATNFLIEFSYSRLADCWNLPSDARRKIPPERRDLRGLTVCVKNTVAPTASTDELDNLRSPQINASQPQNIIFQDPFGWKMIYSNDRVVDTSSVAPGGYSNATRVIQADLIQEFRDVMPKLLECGGTIRNVIVIGEGISARLTSAQRQQLVKCRATWVDDPTSMRCSILSIGEPSDLGELIRLTWPSNSNLEELSRRLSCILTSDWTQNTH